MIEIYRNNSETGAPQNEKLHVIYTRSDVFVITSGRDQWYGSYNKCNGPNAYKNFKDRRIESIGQMGVEVKRIRLSYQAQS